MLIESVSEVSKDRSRVVLENGESFVLYKGEIRLCKIREQGDLPDSLYKRLMEEILPKRAKLRAMNLLKARPYTVYQLTKKLRDGGYPEEIINIAIDYVSSYGYIDDKVYAVAFIKEQSERRSRKELAAKLFAKGIQKDTVEAAFREVYGENDRYGKSEFAELEVILKALKKRGYNPDASYEEKQKTLAYFYRRGFEIDSVHRAMDMCKRDE